MSKESTIKQKVEPGLAQQEIRSLKGVLGESALDLIGSRGGKLQIASFQGPDWELYPRQLLIDFYETTIIIEFSTAGEAADGTPMMNINFAFSDRLYSDPNDPNLYLDNRENPHATELKDFLVELIQKIAAETDTFIVIIAADRKRGVVYKRYLKDIVNSVGGQIQHDFYEEFDLQAMLEA